MNGEELWSAVQDKMNEKITQSSYDTWLKPTKVKSYVDGKLLIEVNNEFQQDWLEGRYLEGIQSIIKELTDDEISVSFFTKKGTQDKLTLNHNYEQKNERYDELLEIILKLSGRVDKLEQEVTELKDMK